MGVLPLFTGRPDADTVLLSVSESQAWFTVRNTVGPPTDGMTDALRPVTGRRCKLVEWVAWFNTTRLHESLGDIPPAEFEALHALAGAALRSPYGLAQRGPAMPLTIMTTTLQTN